MCIFAFGMIQELNAKKLKIFETFRNVKNV